MWRLRRENFDDLAVLEGVIQRDHAAVGLRADTPVADLGVDAVGEVDGRRVRGQVEDVALRREYVNLVLEEVDFDSVEEGLGVAYLVLPLEEAAQPGQLLVEARVLSAFLIGPVRCHAKLGDAMHLLSADLDLDRLARVRDDGGMERL